MLGRDTPPTPLWDGEILEAAFFLVMRGLWRGCFPVPERGFKGCVTVRGAAWAEELRDTVSRGLVLRGIIRQASGDHFDFQEAVLGRHTPPAPLERGGWGGGFSKSMTGFSGLSPEGGIRING